MTILDEIIAFKKKEVASQKQLVSIDEFKNSPLFQRECISLSKALTAKKGNGIIAEFKRKSPSKGMINEYAVVEEVTQGYMQAGAAALSVLTDSKYFGGGNEYLQRARKVNDCPILRKDFVVGEYQIYEAKAIGADVILLIAAALENSEIESLAKLARSLGLEVLLEIHNELELEAINEYVSVVGVNNRNLKDFSVDINRSIELATQIPDDFVKISESGISNAQAILELQRHGYQGFLVGEAFMKTKNPPGALHTLMVELQNREFQ